MYENTVTIGPEFFSKAKNDYSNWEWALGREFMQNSMDCGSSCIDVTIVSEGENTRVVVKNNGHPMSKEVLVGKLLALGASGKDFAGTVGGFGKAKEILYFCHMSYTIHTGSLLVQGCGGSYNLNDAPFIHGTESSILVEGDHTEELISQLKRFASQCQWKGELLLNGERLKTNLRKGAKRRELGWATIYTNKTFPHRMIVRIDGKPMFSRYVDIDRCVLVELSGDSSKFLTANRDSMPYEYRSKLEAFVDELTVDKSSALRDTPLTTYQHFEGCKQEYGGLNANAMRDLITAAYATVPQGSRKHEEENTGTLEVDQKPSYDDDTSVPAPTRSHGGYCIHEFVIKNNTGMTPPMHFVPTGFSAYSRRLVSIWIKCLLELHRLFEHTDTFAVGFIFDDEREAEFEEGAYGKVYYINPAVVVEQQFSRSRSLKKRWKHNNAGKNAILSVAVHEFVHALGFMPHNEGYANKQTDMMGVVLANKKRFNPCFR